MVTHSTVIQLIKTKHYYFLSHISGSFSTCRFDLWQLYITMLYLYTWRHMKAYFYFRRSNPGIKNGIKQFGIWFQIRRVIIIRTTFSSNHALLRSRGLCGDCGVQLHAWQETAESDFALGRTPPMQSYHRWVRANLINPLRQSQKI